LAPTWFHRVRIKWLHWEYWPFGILQAPLFLLWLVNAVRSGSLFYFSASNPSIPTGGMMGESKFDVLEKIPNEVKPKTVRITLPASAEAVVATMRHAGLAFPVIFKPDMGERGWMVRQIHGPTDVENYLREIRIDFIIQEWVALPLEFGVFYVRYPSEENGRVVSITGKEFLSVTGDGKQTLAELVLTKDRAVLQWHALKKKYAHDWATVVPAGQQKELVSIGNHCLGTTFLNANHLITERLHRSFDAIAKKIEGFYFGRFDLRCASVDDLEAGHVQIVELNGCGAEPAHIYQPGFSLVKALGVLLRHWQAMYRVSVENHARGVPYLSFQEGRKIYARFQAAQRSH
jgi:hypothetical protein